MQTSTSLHGSIHRDALCWVMLISDLWQSSLKRHSAGKSVTFAGVPRLVNHPLCGHTCGTELTGDSIFSPLLKAQCKTCCRDSVVEILCKWGQQGKQRSLGASPKLLWWTGWKAGRREAGRDRMGEETRGDDRGRDGWMVWGGKMKHEDSVETGKQEAESALLRTPRFTGAFPPQELFPGNRNYLHFDCRNQERFLPAKDP